jgi:hypothetical protein
LSVKRENLHVQEMGYNDLVYFQKGLKGIWPIRYARKERLMQFVIPFCLSSGENWFLEPSHLIPLIRPLKEKFPSVEKENKI